MSVCLDLRNELIPLDLFNVLNWSGVFDQIAKSSFSLYIYSQLLTRVSAGLTAMLSLLLTGKPLISDSQPLPSQLLDTAGQALLLHVGVPLQHEHHQDVSQCAGVVWNPILRSM